MGTKSTKTRKDIKGMKREKRGVANLVNEIEKRWPMRL